MYPIRFVFATPKCCGSLSGGALLVVMSVVGHCEYVDSGTSCTLCTGFLSHTVIWSDFFRLSLSRGFRAVDECSIY